MGGAIIESSAFPDPCTIDSSTTTQYHRMYLPEELVDKILGHLPPDDRWSLENYSLVSKSWLQPSRRLLFARIIIESTTYQSWLDNISPTNTGLLRHVRSLTYYHIGGDEATGSRCGVYALRDYLPSFFQLQQLTLYIMNIEPTICEHLEWFSAFQHTLSSLSLSLVSITWSAFVALVGYFPNLRDLYIYEPSFQVDDRPVPPLPHPLRGRLVVISGRVTEFPIDRFVGLKLEYEELVMYGRYETSLVDAVGGTLKRLKIDRLYPEPTQRAVPDPHLIYHLHKPSNVGFLPTSAGLLGKSLLDAFRRYDLWACRSTPGVGVQTYPGIGVSNKLCEVG
ncbi:hypothetical protein BDM02DRAFT_493178 [Thelephora ganbajun]|uniref:Uncharacterized protein n=1 Tax=Thelephora ganbajun TaxID=370292 RepID=A0ACB6Z7C9_THEGA|nr:hypothetical protein BDM02DRAFT_493178 [Thelephora ganbajun]